MNRIDRRLITPIYAKHSEDMPPPEDPVYYLLASTNLYLCRNNPYYRSCVPASRWPTELAPHAASLTPNFPPIPRDQAERICGFFGHMSEQYCAEAIALVAWDQIDQVVRTIVPQQVSGVGQGRWGDAFPIGVKYQFPQDLPNDWTVFCDIHSHCEMAAYASRTDVHDEDHFTGLHIVVGRLHQEPPEFHVEGVVDGARFPLNWADVSAYQRRGVFPAEWLDRVTVTDYATFRDFDFDAKEEKPATKAAPASAPTNQTANDSPASTQVSSEDKSNDHDQTEAENTGLDRDTDPRPSL